MEDLSVQEMEEFVKHRFPEAFCEKSTEQDFYAVYKNKNMWRERLSLSPFQGHATATSELQAWREAYAKVSRMNPQTEIF